MSHISRSILPALVVCAGLALCPATTRAEAAASDKGHAGHKHEGGHGQESLNADLGTTKTAGLTIKVIQESLVSAGGDGGFDVTVEGGKPKSVRGWYGTADAKGSVKTKAEKEDEGGFHLHVEVPKTIPADSKLWIEVEPESGSKAKVSFDAKRK
ncbi:MAG: hypothetical protein K1X53_14195 [Candidatus Sumerlaeaceae bacterium]|nr:hypothetical protein [Candidatus Sumerlaeaceae bacterium]